MNPVRQAAERRRRNLFLRLFGVPNLAKLPWTQADVERHAEACAAFDLLLNRDGGFKENRQDHRDALRRLGEATVTMDWYFFQASRALRAKS